jgi:segregation and condensation protein B
LQELEQLAPETGRESLVAALGELREHYQAEEHGVELVELAEGFQILTRPEYAEALAQARIVNRPRKLSVAALETLAVIAYRQPVGRAEIEEIRGVAVDGVLRLLLDRGLIEVVGRGEGIGRPLLYGTTSAFLELLGLSSLDELPKMEELSVVLRPLAEEGEG